MPGRAGGASALDALKALLRGDIGDSRARTRAAAMTGLFFLVVCSVGILRPIKNALALDGLAETQFYKVYFVSAAVVLLVPPYNRLANRVAWKRLIPAVAFFFALNLVVFRVLYVEGSTAFGMIFYGWYDLFAAALVTQFFMAAQLLFDTRESKRVYPLVIAGGSIGATLGGAITGFFAETVGAPNLMLVAAVFITAFGVTLPLLWPPGGEEPARPAPAAQKLSAGELRALAAHPQVRLIAACVLVTVLVKQIVDYEFNTLTEQVFATRDAVSAFQGKFNAATQWLPIIGVAALRPLLARWGVGAAVLLLPAAMLVVNVGLAIAWGLWFAVAAKATDTGLRYSAERAGREILYVPLPEEIKLKAKAYIDVAVEKGIGKALSAVLIFGVLSSIGYRWVPLAAVALSIVWLAMTIAVRREYVRALAEAIRGRFASLHGVFASIADASTLPAVERALASEDTRQVAFALDLVDQAGTRDAARLADELHALLDRDSADLRARALDVLADYPAIVDADVVRARLGDPSPPVREAAIRALHAAGPDRGDDVVRELLASADAGVRTAALACMARGEVPATETAATARDYLAARRAEARAGDAEAAVELGLAAGVLGDAAAGREALRPLLGSPDPRVRAAALRGAGMLRDADLHAALIDGLRSPATREAARDALAAQGDAVVEVLTERLLDPRGDPVVRRHIPGVLAGIPTQASVAALIDSFLAPETDQLLDHRTLKALNKLRARGADLVFPPAAVRAALEREVEAAERYATARRAFAATDGVDASGAAGAGARDPRVELFDRALAEGWRERREGVFRCLGLLHPPERVYRCFLAVGGGTGAARANALEWLERTIGHGEFKRLGPVLPRRRSSEAGDADPREIVAVLRGDGDSWIADCATAAAVALGYEADGGSSAAAPEDGSGPMDLINKVFLLQRVDLLEGARSAHVALLASIAAEVEAEPGETLVRQGEPTEALFALIRGGIELRGPGERWEVSEHGASFGTWALIDDAPSVVEAVAKRPSALLRIGRAEFHDLLADHPELAVGLLQGLARRVRALVA